MTTVDYLVNRF